MSSKIVVAFQGEHGAYSEEAIRQHFGESVETMPCQSFNDMFRAVEMKEATYGLQPVENSLAGTVATSYELFMDYDLRIQGEVILKVQHALLAPTGTKISKIKQVRSHPQALAQCDKYIKRRGFKPVAWFDTAGSARDLADNPEPNTAAIASKLAGKLYNLEILEDSIEDEPFNYTRFFIIGHGDPKPAKHNKTSIVFAVQDQPGALYHAIGEIAGNGINMTKIESRPRRNKPWQYYFYVDFEGHFQDPNCEAALMGLLRRVAILKMLGSYPAASQPQEEHKNGN